MTTGKPLATVGILLALVSLSFIPVVAQSYTVRDSSQLTQTAKLTASDGRPNVYLGAATSVDGGVVVVGEPQDGLNFTGKGAVYVFTRPNSGWVDMTQTAELRASDGALDDGFGASVSVNGDVILAGAPNATVDSNKSQGKVYVFVRPESGWANATETAQLTTSDGSAGDLFGISVGASGDTLVVGASGYFSPNNLGKVYVYSRPVLSGGSITQIAELTTGVAYDRLGTSVATSGDTVVAGAPGANIQLGAVDVFVKPSGGWKDMSPTAMLSGKPSGVLLGLNVAFSGDTIVSGVDRHAYVYERPVGGWVNMTPTASLSSKVSNDAFGNAVAISRNVITVCAWEANVGVHNAQGAAYVFHKRAVGWRSTDRFDARLTASDGESGSQFGFSVASDGVATVVGARTAKVDSNFNQGAAYLFAGQ